LYKFTPLQPPVTLNLCETKRIHLFWDISKNISMSNVLSIFNISKINITVTPLPPREVKAYQSKQFRNRREREKGGRKRKEI
jgi:hypothetical protein